MRFILFVLAALVGTVGAADPKETAAPADDPLNWWSLQPLATVAPPVTPGIPSAWNRNPIDRFIFSKLATAGLKPSAPAGRRALMRRVTYDLTGLPPAPGEVEAFLVDGRRDAYERLVDRLLASPHYGERWGRHWLDVIRFGESRGFERNEIINTAWPFRDYVIRSFNEDKPFDRMVIEQLAGDVIGKDDPAIEIGATFLVAGPYDDVGNQDPVQAQTIRANTIDEVITAVSGAFLGLTVNCARCHDHKFDPVSMEDYYRLYAVFAGVAHGNRVWAPAGQRRAHAERLKPLEDRRGQAQKALGDFEEQILQRASPAPGSEPRLPPVQPHFTEHRFAPVTARFVRFSVASNDRDPQSAAGVRLDEFEIWSAGPVATNVALAAAGAAVKAPYRRAEDFAEAYAPGQVIDGQFGARWIVDGPAELTITLPEAKAIERITFSADRARTLPASSGEIVSVGEYQLEVSLDGSAWQRVADSLERLPIDENFARARRLRAALTEPEARQRLELQRQLEAINAEIRRVPALPVAWLGQFQQPKEPVRILRRGDPTKPGRAVVPGSISTLARVAAPIDLPADAPEGERRLALARWLVCAENPLVPRVLANRLWHYHFGVGLVDTPSDFGKLGGQPTHPELLDYLARRIHFHQWRLKALHREIVCSQTYRQSAAWRNEAAEVDADARLAWRFRPRRLSAEEIRDTMLSVAGVLDRRMGGPGFKLYRYLQDNVATYIPRDEHGSETFRRAIYHHNARATQIDLMSDFDAPDCAFATPRRVMTTSPAQALTLLNHRFTLEIAAAWSGRLRREAADARAQIERAFLLAYARPPSPEEGGAGAALVARHGLAAFCRALLNSNELIYLE